MIAEKHRVLFFLYGRWTETEEAESSMHVYLPGGPLWHVVRV